ncbi:unnamed protein product [Psylliodes chrysocephalus]|uniref:Uncharacterized protein n=1 Tax=Psylliodes chrysocephalus TaxID=3402493 RepID=A0A9P0GIX5_9CUCU|nr:unnamed protein product [Psylliodes chrysocephala]
MVRDINHEDMLDFKNWWPHYLKKICTSTPPTGSTVKVPFTINSFCVNKFKLSKVDDVPLPSTRAYIGRLQIKKKKIEDASKILQYIPEDFLPFFEEKLTWPTVEGDGDEED